MPVSARCALGILGELLFPLSVSAALPETILILVPFSSTLPVMLYGVLLDLSAFLTSLSVSAAIIGLTQSCGAVFLVSVGVAVLSVCMLTL